MYDAYWCLVHWTAQAKAILYPIWFSPSRTDCYLDFLEPVLQDVKNEFPDVATIHFVSDGPTTQYRQKKNFYIFSTAL